MNITIYTITYNEEKMLPFFLDHYSKFASKIVIYDNESTDDTVKIAKTHPLVKNIYSIKTNDQLDDRMYLEVKHNCWKEDTADYVMLVDNDELIYYEGNIVEYLETTNESVYKTKGYDMISENFPKNGISITDQIKHGVFNKFYSKPVVFKPNDIRRVLFDIGTHNGKFYNKKDLKINPTDSELKLLHYKNLSFEYVDNRHKMFTSRMCVFNQVTNAGSHYWLDTKSHKKSFNKKLNKSTKIIR